MERRLREAVAELRHHLDSGAPLDPEARAVLEQVSDEIDEAIEAPDPVEPEVAQSFRRAVSEFEAEHPKLTAAVNRVLETLSAMGI